MNRLIDLGTKRGGAIDAYRTNCQSRNLPTIDPQDCLGIDLKDEYQKEVEAKGYHFKAADVTKMNWPEAEVYLAWDFLEHLPSVEVSQYVVKQMLKAATRAVWLIMPSFEREKKLERLGLRFAWTDWHGHPSHFRLDDLWSVTKGFDCEMVKYDRNLICSTLSPQIVPIDSPVDTVNYDPYLGPKQAYDFDPPLIGHHEVVIYTDYN